MPELLLLRHAKSRWDRPGAEDHERDLAPRGLAAASRMGRLLREEGLIPDLALCSTALRARRTWDLAAAELAREVPTEHARTLYLASAEALLMVARQRGADAGAARLLLIGHDPGLHELARRLAANGDATALAALREKFPTAALVRIALPAKDWRETTGDDGTLLGFWRPRDLR